MTLETGVRTQIALLIYSMTNSVMFGAGLIFVLMVPALNGMPASGFRRLL